ncbi:MAG: biosynthetic-type acetolactate synthase large subunit [Gemmataceae bacterium]
MHGKVAELADSRKPAAEVPAPPRAGADILIDGLLAQGVDTLFAAPSIRQTPPWSALRRVRESLRTIVAQHEQASGFAAEGYARASGKVGVCLAVGSTGAANLVTCLADAKMDSVPLVALATACPTLFLGTHACHEVSMSQTSRPITKHHFQVRRGVDVPRVLREAFHIAHTGRPGPVLVELEAGVLEETAHADQKSALNLPGYVPERLIPRSELERVLELLRHSRRPVIYAGGGVIAAEAALLLRTFAERLGIPVAMTLMGLGGFPGDHDLSLHMLGMHGTVYANYAINDADLLLALGVRFDDRVTGKVSEFAKHGTIIHIDIDPSELNKVKTAHLPIHGDVGQALRDLLELLEAAGNGADSLSSRWTDWKKRIDHWKATEPLRYPNRDDVIVPQYAIHRLWQLVRQRRQLDTTIVTTGVGQHQMWAAQYYRCAQPRTFLTSGGHGAMGFGLPAALGAQAAHPGKTVIDIDGDGSFLMNLRELVCAAQEKLPVKVLLLNNQHLGMVAQWEDRFYYSNRGHTYLGAGADEAPYPDFVTLAQACGCEARQVARQDEFDDALTEMLDSDLPFVLDVHTPYQEHVLPMIPSGMTVRDIIKA